MISLYTTLTIYNSRYHIKRTILDKTLTTTFHDTYLATVLASTEYGIEEERFSIWEASHSAPKKKVMYKCVHSIRHLRTMPGSVSYTGSEPLYSARTHGISVSE